MFGTGSHPVAPEASRQAADPKPATIPAGGQQTVCPGESEMVPLQDAVQAIRGRCLLLYPSAAMGHQRTELTSFLWRHPPGRNEIGGQETGQCHRLTRVRFHPRCGHPFDRLRMSDDDCSDQRRSVIVPQPCIGRCLKHQWVTWVGAHSSKASKLKRRGESTTCCWRSTAPTPRYWRWTSRATKRVAEV